MGSSFTLTLFRHGITIANERKQYLGWTDSSLSVKGQIKARELKNEIIGMKVDKIISSDLKRCQETVKILFPHWDFTRDTAFREMNFGDFERKTYEELKNQKDYQEWLSSSFQKSPPGGESFQAFSERINQGMRKLSINLKTADRKVVLVSHGGVIRFLLSEFVPSDKSFFDWQIPHEKAYQLKWKNIESFRRLEKCMSLSVVPSTEREIG